MKVRTSPTAVTDAPIEWATIPQACRMFSLSRSCLYEALKEQAIRGKLIRKPGNISGRRLISVESVRLWIESQPEN